MWKILSNAILCVLVGFTPVWAAPVFTSAASSAFTGGSEATLSEGGVWVRPGTAQQIWKRNGLGQANIGDRTADCWALYTGVAFNNNQYSRASFTIPAGATAGGGSGIGLLLRKANDNTTTYYRFVIDHAASNNAVIARQVTTTYTPLVTWTQAFTNGDQFTFAIENQVLYVYDKTLTQVATYDDTGGGGPTTGYVGMGYSSTEAAGIAADYQADDWEGGTFASSSSRRPSISPMFFSWLFDLLTPYEVHACYAC